MNPSPHTRRRSLLHLAIVLTLLLAFASYAVPVFASPPSFTSPSTTIFINEIHYDNVGTDAGEAIEIAGPAGTDLTGWTLVLYNGSGGASYDTVSLSGAIPDQQSGFGTVFVSFPSNGIQNGSPDGIALVNGSTVVQFLSYEGTFTAVGGPANGMMSTDIGVSEAGSEPAGQSLRLTGSGSMYGDFVWNAPALSSFGSVNPGQTFTGGPANAPIIPVCNSPLSIIEGDGASHALSASDSDGTVTGITLVSVVPATSDIALANVTPATGVGGTATATVEVASSLAPGSYTATLEFSNDDATPQTAQCQLQVSVTPLVSIPEIQGTGQFSPYAGQTVATFGVVTLFNSSGSSLWLQDPSGDGDPATSDGIFVSGGGFPAVGPRPAVGDRIRIVALVEEQQFAPSLPLTRLRSVALIQVVSSGNPLPAPVQLRNLPDELLLEGINFWEPLEGMLVQVNDARVVAPTNGFGEFGLLAPRDARPGSGYQPSSKHILLKFDEFDGFLDYNPERIMVDDSASPVPNVRPGDQIGSLVGVVDYTFSMYKLQVASIGGLELQSPPTVPVSKRSSGQGNLTVTTFNVENLFDLFDDSAVDSLGQLGVDPGTEWGSGLASTADNTLRRQASVCQGDRIPRNAFDPALEWVGFATDTFDGLGAHTLSCGLAPDLIISEYVEGTSNNKAIEIVNGTGAPIDLGAGNYRIEIYFNGGTSAGQVIGLTGTLANGDVHVLAHSSANAAILAVADQTSSNLNFNGDDAVVLRKGVDKDDLSSTPSAAALETKLSKLALAVRLELRLPDILVAEEIENTAILQEVGDRVNAVAGTDYRAVSFETSDVRGIEVGFLWDANRVELLDAFQLSDAVVPGVSAAFGPTSESPGREPLVGFFNVTGSMQDEPLVIVGNHFKSKSGDEALYGVSTLNGDPPNRVTEAQRKLQARVVRDYVNQLLDADPHALVMATGDLNDFQFPEPGEGVDHPLAILEGGPVEVPLTNLVNLEHEADRFSFVFDGNSQVLDHMLVSPALLDLKSGQDFLHFNAGYPAAYSGDATTPLQVADHDPFEGRFKISKVKATFTLTVLHNNDGESQLINAPGQVDFGGIARFKTLVDNLKTTALTGPGMRGVVMLSSGDNFLAGPRWNASLVKGVPFYDSIALRLVGYDAMALGNHEFDFGPEVLADFIRSFEFATHFVSANLDFSQEPSLQALVDLDVIVKSHIVHENGELIGIVGATTPLLPAISSPRNVIVDPDVAAAIQGEIDFLTANRVDKIVVISHLQNINEDLALAPMLRHVDVMIAGGGDELLANEGDLLVPGDVRNPNLPYPLYASGADGSIIPIITTPGDYKYVGRLAVNFDRHGRVITVDDSSGPVRVAGGGNPDAVPPDPEVQTLVVDPVQAYVANLAANVIATSEVALEGRRDPGVRTMETNLGNLMADSLLWQANQLAAQFGVPPADVALQNGGGIRNNNLIPAGPITELDTFSIAAFSNFVSIVPNIPPAQFKEIMENAVSRIPLADGRFAQIAGFTMVYDPSQQAQVVDNAGTVLTPGFRVREIRLDDGTYIVQNGEVVPDAPSVSISTNDFSARGGDQYPFRGTPFTTLGVTYQQALFNYIVDALNGLISAGQYPEGGEGRITTTP